MMDNLRPCPFCGAEAEYTEFYRPGKIDFVRCKNPDCLMEVRTFHAIYDPSEMASIWNTRPLEDALAAQLAEAQANAPTYQSYEAMARKLAEAQRPHWIPVSEREPDEGQIVVIFGIDPEGNEYSEIAQKYTYNEEWGTVYVRPDCPSIYFLGNITHWMPKPEKQEPQP